MCLLACKNGEVGARPSSYKRDTASSNPERYRCLMARFGTFAEVVTPDSITSVAYAAGVTKNPPGVPIKEILKRTGGVYENKLELPGKLREEVRTVARLTGDQELMKIAELPVVTVSLEHLRNVDPQTRIYLGYWLEYTPEEMERLGLNRERPFDPKKAIAVGLDPSNPWRVKRS